MSFIDQLKDFGKGLDLRDLPKDQVKTYKEEFTTLIKTLSQLEKHGQSIQVDQYDKIESDQDKVIATWIVLSLLLMVQDALKNKKNIALIDRFADQIDLEIKDVEKPSPSQK